MFFIKLKVKGCLKNLTENTEDLIDTTCIRKSNIISYFQNDTKHKIIFDNNKITLLRENNELSHGMVFEETKTHKSKYYLKNTNLELEFNILTTKLIIEKNKIDITYKILETNTIHNYTLEMSDNL